MPPLRNLRQETFCLEAVKANDYASAYAAAGYKTKNNSTRAVNINQLLKNTNVAKRLEELRLRIALKVEINAAKVLNELARIGTSDIRKVVGRDGCITDPSEWDDDTAACVSSIKTEKLFEGKGKDRTHIGYTQELKLWDKNSALTNLAKHFKLLNDGDLAGGLFAGAQVQINMYLPQKETHVVSNGHAALPNGNGTK